MRLSKKSISLALGTVIFAAVALVYCVNLLVATRRDLVYEELQRFAGKDVAFDEFEVTLLTGLGFSAKRIPNRRQPGFCRNSIATSKGTQDGCQPALPDARQNRYQ